MLDASSAWNLNINFLRETGPHKKKWYRHTVEYRYRSLNKNFPSKSDQLKNIFILFCFLDEVWKAVGTGLFLGIGTGYSICTIRKK
jgi:hypothetical protein